MSDELDVEAMIKRFRERAAAVQNRNPVSYTHLRAHET